jgi:hypothetical protein
MAVLSQRILEESLNLAVGDNVLEDCACIHLALALDDDLSRSKKRSDQAILNLSAFE